MYLLVPLVTIWLYALISGLSPSAERAAIIGTAYLAAPHAIGRPRSIVPALTATAAAMVAIDPFVLRDISFQLSFTAVTGIALLISSERRWWDPWDRAVDVASGGRTWWRRVTRAAMFGAAISTATTLATLPLIAFNFHQLPTLGIPATVLALPFMPFLLVTSAMAGLAGLIHPELGQVVGWAAWFLLEYLIRLVDMFARVPWNTISVPEFNGLLVWGYYGVLAMVFIFPIRLGWMGTPIGHGIERFRDGLQSPRVLEIGRKLPIGGYLVGIIGMTALATILWSDILTSSDPVLRVHFLDVGQGQSTFIEGPKGSRVLVDGGPDPLSAALALGQLLGPFDRHLDLVVLTHPDEDHFRDLAEVVERYDVGAILEGPTRSESPLYLEWEQAVDGKRVRRIDAMEGESVILDGFVEIEVLNPPSRSLARANSDTNNSSIVLRLTYSEISFLLTADIEAAAKRRLLSEGRSLDVDVLQVAHHGSKTSTTPGFLSAASPAISVISAGLDNRHGHPHQEVMARLDEATRPGMIYNTAEHGNIEFITDGTKLWVNAEH